MLFLEDLMVVLHYCWLLHRSKVKLDLEADLKLDQKVLSKQEIIDRLTTDLNILRINLEVLVEAKNQVSLYLS